MLKELKNLFERCYCIRLVNEGRYISYGNELFTSANDQKSSYSTELDSNSLKQFETFDFLELQFSKHQENFLKTVKIRMKASKKWLIKSPCRLYYASFYRTRFRQVVYRFVEKDFHCIQPQATQLPSDQPIPQNTPKPHHPTIQNSHHTTVTATHPANTPHSPTQNRPDFPRRPTPQTSHTLFPSYHPPNSEGIRYTHTCVRITLGRSFRATAAKASVISR